MRRYALLALWMAVPAGAGTARAESFALVSKLSTRQMTEQADVVATGRCVRARSEWRGRDLVTLATVSLDEVMKGEESTVTVVLPGGVDATRRIKVASTWAGAPTLRPREEVFLFLKRAEAVPGAYTVMGFSQGKLSIVSSRQGKQVSQDLRGTRLLAGDQVVRGTGTTATLSEFRREIRGYLQEQGGQRP